MKPILRQSFLLVLILALSACSTISSPPQPSEQTRGPERTGPYLSLTVTDEQWIMHFYKYDLVTMKMEEVAQVPVTAQYPLGAFDQRTQTLYYIERDSNRTDQLVKLDLNTGKKEQLTTELFAVNYLIPVGDKIILAANPNTDVAAVQMADYDLRARKLTFWNEDDRDTSIQTLTFNPDTKKLYASLFSMQERSQNMKEAEEKEAKEKQPVDVIPPVHHIVEYDLDGHLLREILSIQEKVTLFTVASDSKLALLRSAPMIFKQRVFYLYDLKSGKREKLSIPDLDDIEHAFFSPDNKGFYFTARPKANLSDGTPNALYYYDLQTRQLQKIFSRPRSYINNFILLH